MEAYNIVIFEKAVNGSIQDRHLYMEAYKIVICIWKHTRSSSVYGSVQYHHLRGKLYMEAYSRVILEESVYGSIQYRHLRESSIWKHTISPSVYGSIQDRHLYVEACNIIILGKAVYGSIQYRHLYMEAYKIVIGMWKRAISSS
ncbi:hypothetical protein ACJMK2_032771 [Sinanodonta woodiana]|uniref:Uncharacterized protein n=1 Tax=Sinanodonta woodiana TaxID=1069815 RepID=A0ABD3X6A0_SINWO